VTSITRFPVTNVTPVAVTADTDPAPPEAEDAGNGWAGRPKGVTRMAEKKISPKQQGSSSSSSKSAATRVTKRKARRKARRKGR
jgi:hypothetical protein